MNDQSLTQPLAKTYLIELIDRDFGKQHDRPVQFRSFKFLVMMCRIPQSLQLSNPMWLWSENKTTDLYCVPISYH